MVDSYKYTLNERVDCLDTFQKWCDAKIIDADSTQVKVTYTGFSPKYDEWLPQNSERLQK